MMLFLFLLSHFNDVWIIKIRRRERRSKKKKQHTRHHLVRTTKCVATNQKLAQIKYDNDYKPSKRLSSKGYVH